MLVHFKQNISKKRAGGHTWGDSEGGLRATTAAGNVGGNAAVISSICPLHAMDLKNTTGKDCGSGRQRHTQIRYSIYGTITHQIFLKTVND